jgi:carboxypeptidase Q
MLDAGVLVRVNDGGRAHGQIRAFQNNTYDVTKAPPTVILRSEDYGRIWRILDNGTPVTLEFTIVNRDYPEGSTSTTPSPRSRHRQGRRGHHARRPPRFVARGDRRDRQRHRLRRHDGSGPHHPGARVEAASDDPRGALGRRGAGAARIAGLRPAALRHVRGAEAARVRQVRRLFQRRFRHGPHPRRDGLRAAGGRHDPAPDPEALGGLRRRRRDRQHEPRRGGTDHTSFNEAGLPGIGLGQDPIEYQSHTWHTNLDTYERIVEEDVKRSAAAIASAVYHLAMRDELLPRFTKDTMPQPPGQGGGRGRGGQ